MSNVAISGMQIWLFLILLLLVSHFGWYEYRDVCHVQYTAKNCFSSEMDITLNLLLLYCHFSNTYSDHFLSYVRYVTCKNFAYTLEWFTQIVYVVVAKNFRIVPSLKIYTKPPWLVQNVTPVVHGLSQMTKIPFSFSHYLWSGKGIVWRNFQLQDVYMTISYLNNFAHDSLMNRI